jgi:hypothetical protein
MHTLTSLGYIQFKTHRVLVSKDSTSGRIYCFKSTQSRCELESFESEEEACDYILTAMPTWGYHLVLDEA